MQVMNVTHNCMGTTSRRFTKATTFASYSSVILPHRPLMHTKSTSGAEPRAAASSLAPHRLPSREHNLMSCTAIRWPTVSAVCMAGYAVTWARPRLLLVSVGIEASPSQPRRMAPRLRIAKVPFRASQFRPIWIVEL